MRLLSAAEAIVRVADTDTPPPDKVVMWASALAELRAAISEAKAYD